MARSEVTKQSSLSWRRGLLRYARNGGILFLSVLPFRLALVDEGADAFLGVARHHVLGHHLRSVTIGVRKAHLGLAVERFLAEFYRIGGFQRDFFGQPDRGIPVRPSGDDAVDEADR